MAAARNERTGLWLRFPSTPFFLALLSFAACPPTPLRAWQLGIIAQQRITIANTVECASCSIRFERIVTIGNEEGDGFIDLPAAVAQTPGHILVVNLTVPHEIRVFNREGVFDRIVGRRGEGPGEYRLIADVRYSDGVVYVIDRVNQRISLLSYPELSFLRSVAIPGRPLGRGLLVVPGGRLLVNAIVPTADAVGYPLHLLDPNGNIQTSFGLDSASTLGPAASISQIRRFAHSRSGGFWTAGFTEYRFERRDSIGRVLQEFSGSPQWFGGLQLRPGILAPPPAEIMDVDEDANGRLWVWARKADPEWRSTMLPINGPHGRSYRIGSYERMYDAVLEVIEPKRGTRIATMTWSAFAMRFVGDGIVVTYDDAGLYPRISCWRLTLLTQ